MPPTLRHCMSFAVFVVCFFIGMRNLRRHASQVPPPFVQGSSTQHHYQRLHLFVDTVNLLSSWSAFHCHHSRHGFVDATVLHFIMRCCFRQPCIPPISHQSFLDLPGTVKSVLFVILPLPSSSYRWIAQEREKGDGETKRCSPCSTVRVNVLKNTFPNLYQIH